jgi:basic membrane lipoprotein Med (substrate-binding protein (PBP1-ABC) superfamily)
VALVAAGTAIAVVATRGGGSKASSGGPARPRVALVVPSSPAGGDDPTAQYRDAVERWRTEDDVPTQVLPIDLAKPGLGGLSGRDRKSIGNFGLVLLAGQFVGAHFMHEFARHPHTRFVVIDPDPINGSLYTAVSSNPNTSDVFFAEGPGAYLAGVLSALMAKRRSSGKRPVAISMVGSFPNVNVNVASPFKDGAKAAVPRIKVIENYSYSLTDQSKCERLANQQIAAGSVVVFADAGACSDGALSAAEFQGVWGVRADQAPSHPAEPQILVSTMKNFGQEVDYAIRSYLERTLPRHHLDIGIERGAVGIVGPNRRVPEWILRRIEQVKQKKMKFWATLATPMK